MSEEGMDEFGYPVATEPSEDEQPEAAPNYAAPPELGRLEWETRWHGETHKCWAEFRDPTELTGRELDALRRAGGGGGENRGEITNRASVASLALLITEWSIPYIVGLPIPSAGRSPLAILEQISAWDKRRLEDHVFPVVAQLLRGRTAGSGREGSGPGSPPTPGRD